MSNQTKKTDMDMSRRKFLGAVWTGSLAFMFAQWGFALFKYIQPVSGSGFGGLIYAGKIEEFAVGSINRILAGRFFISRTENGALALWQKCTHLGCAVPWNEEEEMFHCPCHGSLFSREGEVMGGPAPRPLDRFPIEVKDGELWVDTSQPIERSSVGPDDVTSI